MKNYIFAVLAAITVSLTPTACAGHVRADGQPVTTEFMLTSPVVSLGEPVILSYRITNSSGVPIQIDWQKEDLARGNWQSFKLPPWLDVKIADSLGHTVPFKTDVRRAYAVDRWVHYPAPTLAAGESRNADVLLSIWFTLPHSGHYTVTVTPNLRYTASDGSTGQVSEPRRLDLTANMRDRARLLALARDLAKRVSERTLVPGERMGDLDRLFTLPEDVALPVWKELVTAPKFAYRLAAMGHLERIGTPAALALCRAGRQAEYPHGIPQYMDHQP